MERVLRPEEKHPKVLALYQAVLDLLDEGADINSMKVSDITSRAGIGKGTAYDYFKSKEEIIACAIIYDVEKMINDKKSELDNVSGFREKTKSVFSLIEEKTSELRCISRFLTLISQNSEIGRCLLEQFNKRRGTFYGPFEFLRELCLEGKNTGEIREEITLDEALVLLLGQLVSLLIYLDGMLKLGNNNTDASSMSSFLYSELMQSLT